MLIWGEHGGILTPLALSRQAVENAKFIPKGYPNGLWMLQEPRPVQATKWTAWDSSFSKDGFDDRMKRFLDSLFAENVPHETRWGFKEIRYNQILIIKFLKHYYPKCKIIILIRNPVDTCISLVAANNLLPENATEPEKTAIVDEIVEKRIRAFYHFLNEIYTAYRDDTCVVTYEDLVSDVKKLLAHVTKFLDMEYAFDEDALNAVMGNDIVSVRNRTSTKTREEIRKIATPLCQKETSIHRRFILFGDQMPG